MSLNCVIGEAIYNKDKYIYNKAADLENQGFFPVIFVPSQARMTAEEAYMKYTGKSRMVNTYITSLSRYILKTLDNVKIKNYKKSLFFLSFSYLPEHGSVKRGDRLAFSLTRGVIDTNFQNKIEKR